jgi:AcrR family transcriptional regulator
VKTPFAYRGRMSEDASPPTGVGTRRISPARRAKYRAEREQIMRAAYRLIQQNGSRETSVHDVLRETGFSTRAFYRHFRSKDELVIEMYRVDSDRVTEGLAAAVAAAPTPLAALTAWIDQSLGVVYDARRLRHAAVLSSPEVAGAQGFAEVQVAGLESQRAPLVALLRDGKEQGAFPLAEPEADAFAIQAVVLAHMRSRLVGGSSPTRADARGHTVELFRRALGA